MIDHIRDDFTLMTVNDTFLVRAYHLGAETGLIGYANLVPELHVEKIRAVHEYMGRPRDSRKTAATDRSRLRRTRGDAIALARRLRSRCRASSSTIRFPPREQIDSAEREELREILEDLGEF